MNPTALLPVGKVCYLMTISSIHKRCHSSQRFDSTYKQAQEVRGAPHITAAPYIAILITLIGMPAYRFFRLSSVGVHLRKRDKQLSKSNTPPQRPSRSIVL